MIYYFFISFQLSGHRLLCPSLHRSVRYSASSSVSFPEGEGALLHCKFKLHIYHINFSSPLITFENHD